MGLVQAMENLENCNKIIEEEYQYQKAKGASSDEILECNKISLLKKEIKVWEDIIQEAKRWKIELEQTKLESKLSTNKHENPEELITC